MFAAFLDGWRRVFRAPAASAAIILAIFLLAIPLDVASSEFAPPQLGNRLEAEAVASFLDTGAIYPIAPSFLGADGIYFLLWMFLSGGILDRFARARPVRTAAFFAACGVYFVRFLRLGAVVAAAYWVIFGWLAPYAGPSGDTALVAVLALITLVTDFAKVRAVVEDRHSMLGAIGAAMRFMRRRPIQTVGLYVLNVLAAVLVFFFWHLHLAPAAEGSFWMAFLVAHVYLAFRVLTRLALMASEVAFFQSQLAHAEYTAAPEVVWPDSPAVEAIRNLAPKEPQP